MKRALLCAALTFCFGCRNDGSDDGADGGTDAGTESAGACAAPFEVECPPDEQVACQGPLTDVALDGPTTACPAWSVSDDAPGDGFAVGATDVTFTLAGEGMDASCMTRVVVTDGVPPELTCPPPQTVVRTGPDEELTPPPATAQDACSEPVTVTTEITEPDVGVATVQYTATDAAGNVAMCSADFDVVDAFAAGSFGIMGGALLVGGETEATLGWESPPGDAVSGYRLERADAPDGAWTEVETFDAGARLHTRVLSEPVAYYRLVTLADAGEGGATEAVGAYQITDQLYDIRNVPVPGINFATTLYGVVRHPTDLNAGPYPLIVALHGNHGNCRSSPNADDDFCSTSQDHECAAGNAITVPNAEGLGYLMETLAVQGRIAVSISGNAVNCRDNWITQRAQLIAEHVRQWSDWNTNDGGEFGPLFVGAVDVSRVGLVGHSRGGDAVSNVPGLLAQGSIPGVNVRSVIAVAPTDFLDVEVPDADLMVILPSCDGDVFDLQGMQHYDRSIRLQDGARRAQVFYIGANHNFFNTQWRVSEWSLFGGGEQFCVPPPEPQKQEQQRMLSATAAAWFATSLDGDPPNAYIRADAPSPSSVALWAGDGLDMRWSYSGAERLVIDDFEAPNSPAQNALGESNLFTGWFLAERCFGGACDQAFSHLRWVERLLWEQGNTPLARWNLGNLDATAYDALSLRVVSRVSTLNTGITEQDFRVRVDDSSGESVEVLVSDFKTLQHLYPQQNPREILETVRVPISALTKLGPSVDLATLGGLELEMTVPDRDGSVIVADLELVR